MRKIELYVKDVIRGRRRGFFAYLIKAFLLPLSWFYKGGMAFRNWLYDQGWMRRYVPPIPLVISVGNIVAGGTGKTPVTLLLAQAFYEQFAVAILSRGYRSQAEKLENPILLCEGQGPAFPASYCGDEPYLLAQRLPKTTVIVGGDRKKASFLAAKAGAQIILLDDAMQHRRLARDFDVVVVDINDPFGQDHFLPRGFLREDRSSLQRAHLIVLNHVHDLEQFQAVKEQLKPYTSAPLIGTQGHISAIRNLHDQVVEIPKEQPVGMFCAIAHPEYFRRTLEQLGFTVVSEYILPDHDPIRDKDLEQFAQRSLKKEATWLICTEKDRVKLVPELSLPLPIAWVQMDLQVVVGKEDWEAFLKQAEAKMD